MIPEVENLQRSDTRMERKVPNKYNTRSSTKGVNHVTTFNIGTYYLYHIDPKNYTIKVEPLVNHINCETTGKTRGYIDLVNMDAPVRTKSICN